MLVKKKPSKFINLRIAGQKSILVIFQTFDQKFWKIFFWKSGVYRYLGGFSNMPDSLSMKSDRSTHAQNRRFLYVHPTKGLKTCVFKRFLIECQRGRLPFSESLSVLFELLQSRLSPPSLKTSSWEIDYYKSANSNRRSSSWTIIPLHRHMRRTTLQHRRLAKISLSRLTIPWMYIYCITLLYISMYFNLRGLKSAWVNPCG